MGALSGLRDKFLLFAISIIPRRLAEHCLFLMRANPRVADRLGYHIRKIHYYEPIPDFREITQSSLTTRRVSSAIHFQLDEQLQLLTAISAYSDELKALSIAGKDNGFPFKNEYFAGLDAAAYYALIRHLRPQKVVEIGSGYSTRIADKALGKNRSEGHHGELVCIEPYPEPRLLEARVEIELKQVRIEEVPLEYFDTLESGDILFIDSSHAVKCQGDVVREFLEILPRLKPGVWVHVHDIFFPFDYPAEWLIEKRIAFTEQYLLEAFLAFNEQYAARLCNSWLSAEFPGNVTSLISDDLCPAGYHGGSSFWMQRRP